MFYAPNVLGRKSVLGPVWLAAHHDVMKKMNKAQINSFNVHDLTECIQKQNDEEEMALRLSSFMLIGVSRIWSQKVIHLLHDCGEAYAKITVAFKPSNVDLKDVSKSAQLRAITDSNLVDDSAPNFAVLDLDLELNLTEADWGAGNDKLSQSQALWGDITLPDVVTQGNDDSNVWDGEDPLFYGLAMEAGDNPLDVDFDVAPEKMRDEAVEEPEVRRDSDGSVLMAAGRQSELSKALDVSKADLPDMDFDTEEPVLGRESAAHALSLPGSAMPTPLRVSEANDIEFSMEIPELDVKMSKKAKKVRANLKKDKHTIVNTETYKKWISEPDAVKDILRAPQPIAANRAEARGRRYQTLAAQGKLIETMVKEPLQGFVGKRLTAFFVELGDRAHVTRSDEVQDAAEKTSSKKRKSCKVAEEEEEEAAVQPGVHEETPLDDDVLEQQVESDAEPPVQARPSEADMGGAAQSMDTGREKEESENEESEEETRKVEQRMQERAKKTILILQNKFQGLGNSKQPLSFQTLLGSGESRPDKARAATTFFELLHLHAKGYVSLEQPAAYADISISATTQLHRFRYSEKDL
mmetsp:Transcript_80221/g.117575  ORF Transcript_80221/g.117575 Transcript_80221/m.117575 type:complete len:581 (+) Transcript_80221:77-1819(+)